MIGIAVGIEIQEHTAISTANNAIKTISLVLFFDTEQELTNFANKINTANIEQDFIDLREYFISLL